MATPVRRLVVAHPDLKDPVDIPLPWEAFPEESQRALDELDQNDDGEVSYSPREGGARPSFPVEVHHANDSAERLSRVLRGLARPFPHNNRSTDLATLEDRTRQIQSLRDRVYDNAVLPILGDRTDLTRWRQAQRLLEETGDFVHLYRLARLARGRFADTKNIEFLRVAEKCLLAARSQAAGIRIGRNSEFHRIEGELAQVNHLLDRADREAFKRDTQHPYLMSTPGSPITADLKALQAEDGTVTFGVAVPRSFVNTHSQDLNTAILDYFNRDSTVHVRASAFRDSRGRQEFPLTAVQAERDTAASADDPTSAARSFRIGPSSSFHLDHGRLNRTVFRDRQMAYFRVSFRLGDTAYALGDHPILKFDVILRRGSDERTIPGGFVLQDMGGRVSRDVFASDIHVNERDYEVVRLMRSSLLSLASLYEGDRLLKDRAPLLRGQAEEVERFYESINERVEAALAQWNGAYRAGDIQRVFLAGDLADFANISDTLERQNYRGTNVRRFREIFDQLEAPLYVVSGNHDHHGAHFPLSLHRRNFVNAGELQDLYESHYDEHRFSGVLYFEGIEGLLPTSSSGAGWMTDAFHELTADDPFGSPNDDFLDHHMREVGIYETYGVGLGNGFRVFAWPTETEHFNYSRYLLEEVHDPVAPGVLNGIAEYIGHQHVNGKGPRAETFVAFLRELEAARTNGQRLILMGHYPPFNGGDGPDQTPDSIDTLRGDAAWAVRLASWYYRRKSGETVVSLSVSGHVHHYGESDFVFHFADAAEESRFRDELGRILAHKDPATLFDNLHHLRHEWDLDSRIEIRRVREAGSNGFPGPIMNDFNRNSRSYCRRHGTAFVNLPTVGIPSEGGSGYLTLTTYPDGRIETALDFYRLAADGRVVSARGQALEGLRRGRWEEDGRWDTNRAMPPFSPQTEPTGITTTGPHPPGQETHWDYFPLVYQYPRAKIALAADVGFEWDARSGNTGLILGGELLFPLSHDSHRLWGGPNHLDLGAEYSGLADDLRARAGLDWGLLTTYATVNRILSGDPAYGGEVFMHGTFPHAGISLFGESDIHGGWAAGINLRLVLPAITYRLSGGPHRHE